MYHFWIRFFIGDSNLMLKVRLQILNEGSKVATGYINVLDDVEDTKFRILTEVPETKVSIDLTAEDVYHLFRDRDYSYR